MPYTRTALAATATAIISLALPLAAAHGNGTAECGEERVINVEDLGLTEYESIGRAVGKRNGSTETSQMEREMTVTKEKETSWTYGGKAGINWGIVQVEGGTDHTVTKRTTRGERVSNTLTVPAGMYGYMEPKAEFRSFSITEGMLTRQCTYRETKDHGVLRAITAAPFFAECVADEPCTPKP